MNPMMRKPMSGGTSSRRGGFSLIEVTLALGIVAFGLLSILGIYSGMLGQAAENTDRRDIGEATDALRAELNENFDFSTVFDWVLTDDPKQLVYVTFRANDEGEPDPTGDRILSTWLDDWTDWESYETAREGRWLKAELRLAPNNNPSSLPSSSDDYDSALLLVQMHMAAVPTPNIPFNSPESLISSQIGILR